MAVTSPWAFNQVVRASQQHGLQHREQHREGEPSVRDGRQASLRRVQAARRSRLGHARLGWAMKRHLPIGARWLTIVDRPDSPQVVDWPATFQGEREGTEALAAMAAESDRRLRVAVTRAALAQLGEFFDPAGVRRLDVEADSGIKGRIVFHRAFPGRGWRNVYRTSVNDLAI